MVWFLMFVVYDVVIILGELDVNCNIRFWVGFRNRYRKSYYWFYLISFVKVKNVDKKM